MNPFMDNSDALSLDSRALYMRDMNRAADAHAARPFLSTAISEAYDDVMQQWLSEPFDEKTALTTWAILRAYKRLFSAYTKSVEQGVLSRKSMEEENG